MSLASRVETLERVGGAGKSQLILHYKPPETSYHAAGGDVYTEDDLPRLEKEYNLILIRVVYDR